MIKSFVYVLRCSDSTFYIGSTRNLIKRLQAHKNGKVKTTKNRRPIKLFYKEELLTYTEARKRELYLKSGAGRDWLKSKIWRSGRVVEGAALARLSGSAEAEKALFANEKMFYLCAQMRG